MFETRKEGVTGSIVDFCKKKNARVSSVLQKEYFREKRTFRSSEFNTRSSQSVINTIKRRVVSRGARD